MQRVTIVGSGFAALTAIKTLRSRDKSIDITVVSPKAEFHYLPGSIWIPSGIRKPDDLVIQLDPFFHRMQVNHHPAEAGSLCRVVVDLQRLPASAMTAGYCKPPRVR